MGRVTNVRTNEATFAEPLPVVTRDDEEGIRELARRLEPTHQSFQRRVHLPDSAVVERSQGLPFPPRLPATGESPDGMFE